MKQRGKFCTEDSDSIPGRSVYLAGYIKLSIQSEKVSRILIILSCSHCHLLMFLDFLFRPDGRKLTGSIRCCCFLIRFNLGRNW